MKNFLKITALLLVHSSFLLGAQSVPDSENASFISAQDTLNLEQLPSNEAEQASFLDTHRAITATLYCSVLNFWSSAEQDAQLLQCYTRAVAALIDCSRDEMGSYHFYVKKGQEEVVLGYVSLNRSVSGDQSLIQAGKEIGTDLSSLDTTLQNKGKDVENLAAQTEHLAVQAGHLAAEPFDIARADWNSLSKRDKNLVITGLIALPIVAFPIVAWISGSLPIYLTCLGFL